MKINLWRNRVSVSTDQAIAISAILEIARWENVYNPKIIRSLEDVIDAQIWGKKYVANRRSDSEQRGK
jgi:hypothetical protein